MLGLPACTERKAGELGALSPSQCRLQSWCVLWLRPAEGSHLIPHETRPLAEGRQHRHPVPCAGREEAELWPQAGDRCDRGARLWSSGSKDSHGLGDSNSKKMSPQVLGQKPQVCPSETTVPLGPPLLVILCASALITL